MSDTIENAITEKEARQSGFTILAGPFIDGEMAMAYKILGEVKRNDRHAALVERIRGKKVKQKYYEVWQKSNRYLPFKK
jgi:hypothetical protein